MTAKEYQFLQTKSIGELKLMKNQHNNPALDTWYDQMIKIKKDLNKAKSDL